MTKHSHPLTNPLDRLCEAMLLAAEAQNVALPSDIPSWRRRIAASTPIQRIARENRYVAEQLHQI